MQTQRSEASFLAERVRNLTPSPTLAVSDRARQLKADGIDVIDLGGGDPDFITPEPIRRAAIDAMNAGDTHYVASSGTPAFRRAIAAKLRNENGLDYDWQSEIIVTPGAKSALFQAALTLIEPGVEMLVLEPAWVSYVPMIELAGGTAVPVSLDPDDDFAITRAKLEGAISSKTRAILLNSPNNPTGRVTTRTEYEVVAAIAIEHDLLVFADEMYEKIVYDGRQHISLATLPGMFERTLTFNGLSKAYAMTGWRLGYVAGPSAYLTQIAKVHSHSVTCATSFAQAGGVAALTGDQGFISEMVTAWDRRRRMVGEGLSAIRGLRCPLPEGAFYAMVDARATGMSSVELSDRILGDVYVAVVPGIAFGAAGEGHFRLSFATDDASLSTSVERIAGLLGRR